MKKIVLMIISIISILSFCGCSLKDSLIGAKEHERTGAFVNVKPDTKVKNAPIGLSFTEMHNEILDELSQVYTPFFFIKENCLDISGSNNPRQIILTTTSLNGTSKDDYDLFLSYILLAIGTNAAEQDFRYKPPTQVEDSFEGESFITYADFGSVFNEYELIVKSRLEDGSVMYDLDIKPGEEIPVSSKYWKE